MRLGIVTSKTLGSVLEHYPTSYRSSTFELFPNGRGFSGAMICRIETDLGTFCVRGWPTKSYPAERILGLHSLLAHLFRQGVTQVSVPIEAISGLTLAEHEGRFWQIEPWMPGVANFQDDCSQTKLKSAMQCLAKFHAATRTFQPTEEHREWFFVNESGYSDAVQERLIFLKSLGYYRDDCESFLSPKKTPMELKDLFSIIVKSFCRLYSEVETGLLLCASEKYFLQPCLKDIWHDHILFTEEEATGLIDASACRSDSIATDLSRLIGSFCGNDGKLWDTALQEYETFHPLNTQERILLEVLERSGVLLSGMNWVEKFRDSEFHSVDISRISNRLNLIVERLECFE